MIKSFEIKNFRCFNTTNSNNLVRINLFGGRNNAGKTALLESLLLMSEPSSQTIAKLLKFRRVNYSLIKEMPSRVWDNFFFQQKKELEISFSFLTDKNNQNNIKINCEEAKNDFVNMVKKDDDIPDLNAFNNKVIKSVLRIISQIDKEKTHENKITTSAKGINGKPYKIIDSRFIPASFKMSNFQLATEFDKAKLEGNSESLLDAFRVIENSIEKIESLKIGEAELYLKRENENYMPLTLYGDAMNRMAEFILTIINNKNSVLLIDEIENGIHYENQEEIWKLLFDLCKIHNVQLFATSHSAEMIEAFKNTITNYGYESEGNYFEMSRHIISKEIVIQKIPIYSLDDKLKNNNPIRGEKINKRKNQ